MNPDLQKSFQDKYAELIALRDAREKFDWSKQARPEQRFPLGDWAIWIQLAGRGFGKTRTGAEAVRTWARHFQFVDVCGPTQQTVRDICVEGPSGILAVCPDAERPEYLASLKVLRWPSGCVSRILSADEPERLRGGQREKLWADEFAAWSAPSESWNQLALGLRLGKHPQALITTTPRPLPILEALIAEASTVVTRGSTFANRANLAESFYSQILTRYAGTRLEKQEILGELLEDTPGALWSWEQIEQGRLASIPKGIRIIRTAVAIDPATTSGEDSDETGIIKASMDDQRPAHFYLTDDVSGRYAPDAWARRAIELYADADVVVAEKNQGGEMVSATLRNVSADVNIRTVHASKNKITRAEPIAGLYAQNRVHHIGNFPVLEDQLVTYAHGSRVSPDRLDALVWALTELSASSGRILGLIELAANRLWDGFLGTFRPDDSAAEVRIEEKAAVFEIEKQILGLTATKPEGWTAPPVPSCPACQSALTLRISAYQSHCNMCGLEFFLDGPAKIYNPNRAVYPAEQFPGARSCKFPGQW